MNDDDNVIPLVPLPRIVREEEPPTPPRFEAERLVRHLRMREQEPWVTTDAGEMTAIECNLGSEVGGSMPILRLRIDLVGDMAGNVRAFLMLNEEKRRRLALFPDHKPPTTTDDVEDAIDKTLRFCRELAEDIVRATRAVP